jgi:hypothetical protein
VHPANDLPIRQRRDEDCVIFVLNLAQATLDLLLRRRIAELLTERGDTRDIVRAGGADGDVY